MTPTDDKKAPLQTAVSAFVFGIRSVSSAQDCYQLAAKLAIGSRDWILCHGIVTGRFEGQEHDHAWVEYDLVLSGHRVRMARDDAAKQTMPAAQYRKVRHARDVVEYGPATTFRLLQENRHWGPWDRTARKHKRLSSLDRLALTLRKIRQTAPHTHARKPRPTSPSLVPTAANGQIAPVNRSSALRPERPQRAHVGTNAA